MDEWDDERATHLRQLRELDELVAREAEKVTGQRAPARWREDGHDVAIELGQGEVAALALGLGEKSTAAQRAHAREIVRGWVGQAFGQLADELGFRSE